MLCALAKWTVCIITAITRSSYVRDRKYVSLMMIYEMCILCLDGTR
jgi:hypothetical protein